MTILEHVQRHVSVCPAGGESALETHLKANRLRTRWMPREAESKQIKDDRIKTNEIFKRMHRRISASVPVFYYFSDWALFTWGAMIHSSHRCVSCKRCQFNSFILLDFSHEQFQMDKLVLDWGECNFASKHLSCIILFFFGECIFSAISI